MKTSGAFVFLGFILAYEFLFIFFFVFLLQRCEPKFFTALI